MYKRQGYFYAPDPDVFWKQGYSQDNSFIYVTTQYLTATMLDSLAKEVDAFESLLICAPAFDVGLNKRYDNITVKKIPQSVLDKCEYGVDVYKRQSSACGSPLNIFVSQSAASEIAAAALRSSLMVCAISLILLM